MEKPWKVILAFIGVFVAGVIFGGVFTLGVGKKFRTEVAKALQTAPAQPSQPQPKKAAPQPGQTAQPGQPSTQPGQIRIQPAIMRQLTQRLNPTPDQQKSIRPVVARATEDLQRLQREHVTDTARVMDRMYEDISALLSPEQRAQLEKMRQEMAERVRQDRLKRDAEGPNRAGAVARPATKTP